MSYPFDARVYAIHCLRVNVKSLAAEARTIRHEASRASGAYYDALTEHRRGRLREEARLAQLALAFVRKRPYLNVEVKTSKKVSLSKLKAKLFRYGLADEKQLQAWLEPALVPA